MELQYIKIGNKLDFDKTNYIIKKIIAKSIAIIKKGDNSFYAVEASCKHQGANLLENEGAFLTSNIAICPRHQWEYNLETGECLSNSSAPLRIFPVELRGDDIYVGFEF